MAHRMFEIFLTRTHGSQLAIGAANLGIPTRSARSTLGEGVDTGLYPYVGFDGKKGWQTSFDGGRDRKEPTQVVAIYAEARGEKKVVQKGGPLAIFASFADRTAGGDWSVSYLRHRQPELMDKLNMGGLMDVDAIACMAVPELPLLVHSSFSATDMKSNWAIVEAGEVPPFVRFMLERITSDVEGLFGQGQAYFRDRMKEFSRSRRAK